VLVLIGATEDGSKELLAVVDGYRESSQSWRELRGQVKRLGLSGGPKLASATARLAFWIALQEEYGQIARERCWVHKTTTLKGLFRRVGPRDGDRSRLRVSGVHALTE
jgi:putative transposase